MNPVHFELSALNESGSKWTNAVDRMTPVPKCLPMKKTREGMRRNRARFEIAGNDTAMSEDMSPDDGREVRRHTKE